MPILEGQGKLLKSNSFSVYLLGVSGGDLKAAESSSPSPEPDMATLWLGTLVGAEAKGWGALSGKPRQLPGWRLGGLNSFTAQGRLTEWAFGPSLAVARNR